MERRVRPLPDRELLLKAFRYDQKTGHLHQRKSGKIVDGHHSQGYWQVYVNGEQLLSHRIIWKMMTGDEPPEVDHLDGDRANNKWKNLRSDNGRGNRKNKKLTAQNTSGLKGACLCRRTGLWRSTIRADGIWHWLGRFPTKEEAHAVYLQAAAQLHGKFANSGFGPIP